MNLIQLVALLGTTIEEVIKLVSLIQKLHSEGGRDPTPEEIAQLDLDAAKVDTEISADIERREAAGEK